MASSGADHELIERLNAALAGTGFAVRAGEEGCMLVERRGFLRGVWHCEGGAYAWIPGGYREPTEVVECPDALIEYTVRRAARA